MEVPWDLLETQGAGASPSPGTESLPGRGSLVAGAHGLAVSGGPGPGPPPTRADGPALRQQPQPGAEFYYPPFTILAGKQI